MGYEKHLILLGGSIIIVWNHMVLYCVVSHNLIHTILYGIKWHTIGYHQILIIRYINTCVYMIPMYTHGIRIRFLRRQSVLLDTDLCIWEDSLSS